MPATPLTTPGPPQDAPWCVSLPGPAAVPIRSQLTHHSHPNVLLSFPSSGFLGLGACLSHPSQQLTTSPTPRLFSEREIAEIRDRKSVV